MKKILFAIVCSWSIAYGQYDIKCNYLKNPELVKGYVDSCARFWFSSYDTVYGGFYSNVSRNGKPADLTYKNMLTQSRTAYGMARAFMLSGDTTYLNYAQGALNFMYDHAWDKTNQGWFNEMNRQGSLTSNPDGNYNTTKWSFMQCYALVGIGAMVEATQNAADWKYYLDGRAILDKKLWDSRPGVEGYYNTASVDWSKPNGKGFTPTMDAMTTHVLYAYLLTGRQDFKERLLDHADNVVHYMLPAMRLFKYGYPEEFSSDWDPNLSNTLVFTGHLLKSAWCLTRAYLIEPRKEYLDFSSTILDQVLALGYDTTYGGCYKEYNGLTGSRNDTNKEWWELEQMFNASIMNYYISGNERYLKAADQTLDYYMKYFVDHTYGEVYQTLSRTGVATTTSKASYWKAGYHSIELGYYVYLYGNLYLHHQPVTLYYYLQPVDSIREIKLYPLAIEDAKLTITGVQLNGRTYTDYLSAARTLKIQSGTGGIFRVTFERTAATGIAVNEEPVRTFELQQNYPNPFNPSTTIRYTVKEDGPVRLEVFDVTGRMVKTLMSAFQSRGTHTILWDGTTDTGIKVASGMYYYDLVSGGATQYKKAIVVK
jgi:mannose/cellobiose epimerase-like protein (N-acyl-D-glucosamine 2-epimerase family)